MHFVWDQMNECVRMDVCMFHVSPSARNVKLLPPTIVTKLKSKCSQNCSCWWKWFYACIHACLSSACCKRVITRFCRWFLQHIVCNSLSMFSFFLFEKTFFSIYYLVGGQRIAEKSNSISFCKMCVVVIVYKPFTYIFTPQKYLFAATKNIFVARGLFWLVHRTHKDRINVQNIYWQTYIRARKAFCVAIVYFCHMCRSRLQC